jgi:hypothetical protein
VWLTAIVAQLYLISTWYWLSFGASIGHRGFFTVFPLLLAGAAAFTQLAVKFRRERALVATWWGLTAANAVVTVLVLTARIDPQRGYPANHGF